MSKLYYDVDFNYTQYGKVLGVRANSIERAKEEIYKQLIEHGLEGLEYESIDRDFKTQDGEVVRLEKFKYIEKEIEK